MSSRMVVRLADGTLSKGFSYDFVPGKSVFHLQVLHSDGVPAEMRAIRVQDIHAIFFVRDFAFGRTNRYTPEDAPHEPARPPTAGSRHLRVTCVWGEVLEGLCYGYDPERPGFFLFPTEPLERTYNLERAFFTRHGVREVDLPPAA